MTRLTRFAPDILSDRQRAVYDAITGGKRASGPSAFELAEPDGSLRGPFNAMLVNPELGDALQRVGAVLRYESTLPDLVRELGILTVAVEWQCEFEWYAHERVARHLGMPDKKLEELRAGTRPSDLSDAEAIAYDMCRTLSRDRFVDDELFAAAREEFGECGVTELIFLYGYYTALAASINAFNVGLPSGVAPAFLD